VKFPRIPAFKQPSLTLPEIRGHKVTGPIAAGIVGGALALGMGAAWGWSALSTHTVAAAAAPTASLEPSVAGTSSAPPSASATVSPGEIIATVVVNELGVYAAPGQPKPASTLSKSSAYGEPRTLLVTDKTGIGDVTWFKVALPVQPNGTTGWIRASDVATSSTDVSVHVFLDERTLELRRGNTVILATSVVVGAPAAPTPIGLFYVTDPLDFSATPTGIYGAYALGLSGFSNVLGTINGGPPQIAVEGTIKPSALGTAASNGCILLANDAVLEVAHTVGLGTPVYIEASRAGTST
jgi:lipoprotein-anchoring transpeptidase ErfK/SrfK